MKKSDTNIYFDPSSDSWVAEVHAVCGWYVFGYYGSKEDAEKDLGVD